MTRFVAPEVEVRRSVGARSSFIGLVGLALLAWGCGDESGSAPENPGSNGASVGGMAPSPAAPSANGAPSAGPSAGASGQTPVAVSGVMAPESVDEGTVIVEDEGSTSGDATEEEPEECAAVDQPTELRGVTLVFGFDVSASMASDDVARQYKWEPTALAASGFFASPDASGVSAQLTFFPSENAGTFTGNVGGGFGQGGDDMAPGGDDMVPGGDDMAPGGDDMAPGGDDMAPGGDDMAPGGDDAAASGDDDAAGADDGQSFTGQGFGGGGDTAAACTEADYAEPDIPLTALPAEIFGTTIDATEPDRLGTPTRWILPAIIDQAAALRDADPNSNYAVVLVTDGLPTDCTPTDDSIEEVAALAARGPELGIPVYVVGVETPEDATIGADLDGLQNLTLLAQQGGTETAFLIDTGDVQQTVTDFTAAINQIKESTFSCTMAIPPSPEGETLDLEKVNVSLSTDMQVDLVYSPDCSDEWSWHFDDETAPSEIVLCESSCAAAKEYSGDSGSVSVQFGCERRLGIAR